MLTEMILCRSGCQYFGNIFVAKGGVVACLLKFANFLRSAPSRKAERAYVLRFRRLHIGRRCQTYSLQITFCFLNLPGGARPLTAYW